MAIPLLNRRDLQFLLYELLEVERLTQYARYAEHGRETFDAALDLAENIAAAQFAPHNRKADLNEPELVDGRVRLIPEVKPALDAYNAAGFLRAHLDYAEDGMQLPHVIATACDSFFQAANVGTAAYTMLSKGAANLLSVYGSEAQKSRFMRPIHAGRFSGTMCLSEPHAGSSLADIRTRAEPQPDGSYRLTGAKMWISGAEHELSENIINLVLAKIPGGPQGVKGISLFIVPKFRVNDDGTLGARNDVRVAGLNHKMGYRGTVNTFLKFGENGDCVGYLIGQPHTGMAQMFHMMNESRIAVGMGAVMLGYAGYQHSLAYAKERPQGRHPDQKDPSSAPVMLVEHADVKRMLLAQKCIVEGGYALGLFGATLVDQQQNDPEPVRRTEAGQLLELLTPIIKAWPSQWCLKANELAIQVLGGAGYTRDYPVEQYYRDNRLNPIHEGTNGIQALDLLGRKVLMNEAAALRLLSQRIVQTVEASKADAELQPLSAALAKGMETLAKTTLVLAQALQGGKLRLGLANAALYLEMMGHLVVAWLWLRQAQLAQRALPRAVGAEHDFYAGKLQACRYFFHYELPLALQHAKLLQALDSTTLDMQPQWF
jgi:alkylation response protein AidB-like acyl-CoA dehydrogenase